MSHIPRELISLLVSPYMSVCINRLLKFKEWLLSKKLRKGESLNIFKILKSAGCAKLKMATRYAELNSLKGTSN